MEAMRELAHETWSEQFDALSKELLNAQVSAAIISAPAPPVVEALAPITIAADGQHDVRTVITIEHEPELT
jgi:hypothetical protein